jgi:hypothetical protein
VLNSFQHPIIKVAVMLISISEASRSLVLWGADPLVSGRHDAQVVLNSFQHPIIKVAIMLIS